jgi:hypothetical protein
MIKKILLVLAVLAIGYSIFSLGGITTSKDFKKKLDSLDKVNDSLYAENSKDDLLIADLKVQDSILQYAVEHQKTKIVKIKVEVESQQGKIDTYDEHELVDFYYTRYPKDTITNRIKVAQPVLTSAAKHLVAYDGAIKEIVIKDSIINLQIDRISKKDSTIVLFQNKEGRYKSIIGNQDLKIAEWSKQYNDLYLQHNKMLIKNKITRIGTGVIIGGLIYMTIAK